MLEAVEHLVGGRGHAAADGTGDEALRRPPAAFDQRGQRDSGPAGTGIGLSIVKNVADTHEAKISLGESSFESGLAVNVAFEKRE